MFDDHPNANRPGTPPSNLPIGEPEDMFADTDPVASKSAASAEMPVAPPVSPPGPDAGPAMVSAMDAGILRPKGVEAAPFVTPPLQPTKGQRMPFDDTGNMGGGIPAPTDPAPELSGPVLSRGFAVVGIVLVALLIVGGGGWWVYSSFVKAPTVPDQINTEQEQEEDDSIFVVPTEKEKEDSGDAMVKVTTTDYVVTTSTEDTRRALTEQQRDSVILFGEQPDDDKDQLFNEMEAELGTNPKNWDSDGDELGDGDEVLIWGTDPLNPDTDGDGYLDGKEISSGYNPLGNGRLFDREAAQSDPAIEENVSST